jgi:hypothetical protein
MSTVYIVGAGGSYGDTIEVRDTKHPATPARPPMICGFFRREMFEAIGYEPAQAEKDYPDAFEWIRVENPKTDDKPVGEPPWDEVNLEEIFTAVELRREFESPESDAGARLRIIRNQLVRYITRILALCTQNCYGEYSRGLVGKLDGQDSLFTFNWDLLLDEPFTIAKYPKAVHLDNFLATRHGPTNETVISQGENGSGLFLKLHGSLNWFLCTNPKCKFASEMQVDTDTQHCLLRAAGIRANSDVWAIDLGCSHCGSAAEPLIVPPLVRKPITDSATIRSIWGLARNKLQAAERMVFIGFSVAPTDFFVSWLLHSAVLDKPAMDVVVVNPLNDPKEHGHNLFMDRMKRLFPYKLNTEFREFAELEKFVP